MRGGARSPCRRTCAPGSGWRACSSRSPSPMPWSATTPGPSTTRAPRSSPETSRRRRRRRPRRRWPPERPRRRPLRPPAPPSDRISILLTGIDSGHDRQHALTDTMLVISVSPSKGTVAMVSFPRDLADFQLYSGGTFHDKLNALRTTAALNPTRFPDGPDQTLANQLGYFLGIRIEYTAAINLVGFERMINLV